MCFRDDFLRESSNLLAHYTQYKIGRFVNYYSSRANGPYASCMFMNIARTNRIFILVLLFLCLPIMQDMVGCFPIPRSVHSPLMKSPQSPDAVDTKFLVMTRQNRSDLILITYGDEHVSMINSNLKPELPTKIIIHGFKGSGRDKAALVLSNALLDLVIRVSHECKMHVNTGAKFSENSPRPSYVLTSKYLNYFSSPIQKIKTSFRRFLVIFS